MEIISDFGILLTLLLAHVVYILGSILSSESLKYEHVWHFILYGYLSLPASHSLCGQMRGIILPSYRLDVENDVGYRSHKTGDRKLLSTRRQLV